ncbi:BTB/POZ domain-containing protein KCTD6 [Strongylocentrotus purpuratus]|uniref:BTB domain-containing protein n=1 Tax=Strongylocentrotus purpuratus TaxID=7668 RepID=A0A7M7GMN1_STRPU|nr:BTB/POZ domain-containing protein KCTD6 [Strongylocentrotus purpuratus]
MLLAILLKKPLQNGVLFSRNMTDFVSLNVGGTIYTTSRATLIRFPDSMLGSMFSDRLPSNQDDKGNYLIDGDGPLFRHVLNFLRRSILVLPEDFKELDMLAQEADFYQIKELIDAVTQIRNTVAVDREEEKRAKDLVKEQEFLEVEFECANGRWIIFGSSEILQKIPVVMEGFGNHLRLVRNQLDHIFGPEENGLIVPREQPLNRVKLFRQITQLGFKLVSVSSSGGDERSTDRWIFTRDVKSGSAGTTQKKPKAK